MIPVLRDDVFLTVGLPVYGGYHAHFVPALLNLALEKPCHLKIKPAVGDSLVCRARNRIAKAFLEDPKATHLLFIDTDLIFSPEHVARLISHDLPLVCGCYPKKQPGLDWVLNTLPGEERDPATGLQRVRYAGTGFMLIRRDVFEAIDRIFPEIRYQPDDGEPEEGVYRDFFRVGPCVAGGRRRYLSEDWYFCEMAQQAGIPTFVDTNVVLKHCGDAIYPLQMPVSEPVASEPPEKAESEEPGRKKAAPARKRAKGKGRSR